MQSSALSFPQTLLLFSRILMHSTFLWHPSSRTFRFFDELAADRSERRLPSSRVSCAGALHANSISTKGHQPGGK